MTDEGPKSVELSEEEKIARAMKMAELRSDIEKAEHAGDEDKVLLREAELRALELGVPFERDAFVQAVKEQARAEEKSAIRTRARMEQLNTLSDSEFDEHFHENLYTYCKGLAEYMKEQEVSNIMFIDTSARPSWVGIHEYWKTVYPDTPKPHFYFVNPRGFETFHSHIKMRDGKLPTLRTDAVVDAEFTDTFKALVKEKDKPLVLFDVCSHTGATMRNVETTLKRLGFSDVRLITATPPEVDSRCNSVLIFDDHQHMHICYPFGEEHGVTNAKQRVISNRSLDVDDVVELAEKRRAIREVIQIGLTREAQRTYPPL